MEEALFTSRYLRKTFTIKERKDRLSSPGGYVLDLNGDGRDDIVFLVDRLLCYYQKPLKGNREDIGIG